MSAHTGGRADQRISVWYWIAASNQASGSHTVTPSASEQWTATVVRVPAGEFDATTPIGANATGGNSSNSGTTVPITAFTAGATDGDGRLCAWLGVDDDPITSTPDGWTNHASEDPGAVSGTFSTRNAAVTNSESIGSVSWGIAGDSSATYAYILRAPIDPNGTATPGGLATTASLGTATSTGAATATPGGLATTASLGTATSTGAATAAPGGHYWDAEDVAWDDGITAWDACAAASVAGEALPVGLALASALSTVTASGTATAAVTGQATTAVLGTVTAAGAAAAIVEGLAITASLGTAVASANAIALPAGQEMAAAIGTVTASGTATAAPVGQWAEMAIGISIASGAAVGAPSGQSVTAHVGSVTPTGDGNAQVAGLLLASYLGTVVATGDAPPTFRAAWARGCNTYLRAH